MGNWLWGHHYIESDKTHTDSNERTSEEPSQEESESEENNEEQQSTTGSSESIIDDHISSQEEDLKLGVHDVVFSHQEREGGQGEGSHEDETSSLCNTTTTTTTSKPADVSVTTKLGFCESNTPSSQIPSSNKQKHHPGTEQSHKHIHFDPEANGKTMTKDNVGKEKKGHSATAQANNCTSMPSAFANISQWRSPTDATQFKSRNEQVHLEGNAKTKLQMETFEARNDEESAVEKGGSVQLIKEAIAPVVASNLVTWESFTKLGKVSISFESKKSNAPTACKKESRSRKRMKVNKRVTSTERWDIWSRLCEPVMKVGTAQHTFEPTLIKYNMATDERQFDEKPQVEIPSGHPRFQNAKGPIQDDAIPKDHKGEAVQHLDQSARFGNKDASPGIINEVCQDLEEFQSKGVVEDKEDFLSLHSIATNQNESIRGKCKDVNKAKAKQKYKKKYMKKYMKKYKKKCNKKRKKNRRKRANNRAYNKVKNKVKYSKSSFQERPVFTRKDCQADTEKNDATSIEKDHTCLETKTKAMDNFTEKGQEEEKVVWKPFCMASDGCKHHKAKKNAAVARSHQILQDDFTSLENMPEWYASLMVFAILIGGTPFYLQRLQRPQQK